MRILITRHGESMYNIENRIGGNPSLSEKGHEYGKRLVQFCKNTEIPQVVFSSMLKRAGQTAAYLFEYIEKFQKLSKLNEINAGEMENLTYQEFEEKFPEEFEKRKNDKLNYTYPNGESYKDLIIRTKPVIENIIDNNQDTFIVCHRAVTRALLFHLTNVSEQEIPHLDIPLHAILELEGRPGNMSIKLIEM